MLKHHLIGRTFQSRIRITPFLHRMLFFFATRNRVPLAFPPGALEGGDSVAGGPFVAVPLCLRGFRMALIEVEIPVDLDVEGFCLAGGKLPLVVSYVLPNRRCNRRAYHHSRGETGQMTSRPDALPP